MGHQHTAPLLLAIVCVCCAGAMAWTPSPVLVAFGDSLTDSGNFFRNITGSRLPRPDLYFRGRFTNAPGTWADQVPGASDRKVQVENFAFGGATACAFPNLTAPLSIIPNLAAQIALFNGRLQTDTAFAKRLASKLVVPTIWMGHNDLQLLPLLPPDVAAQVPVRTVQCVLNATASLLAAGHKAVVVGTLAPLDLIPNIVAQNLSDVIRPAVAGINAGFAAGVAALQQQYPDRKVLLWDANQDITNAIIHFRCLGFKYNNTHSCISGPPSYSSLGGSQPTSVCKRPSEFIFYDPVHPTAKGHGIVRDSFLRLLRDNRLLKHCGRRLLHLQPTRSSSSSTSAQGSSQ